VSHAEKISVTMTPDMLRAIRDSVAAGEYASASEALRDAVRVWQRERAVAADRLEAIRDRVRRSLDDPSPSLTEDELDTHLALLFADAARERGDAPA
jgi:antitoxin ParD1/3/4